jgi:hypothetical protein
MARIVLNLTDSELISLTKQATALETDATTLVRRWIGAPPSIPTVDLAAEGAKVLANGQRARSRKGQIRITEAIDMDRGTLE